MGIGARTAAEHRPGHTRATVKPIVIQPQRDAIAVVDAMGLLHSLICLCVPSRIVAEIVSVQQRTHVPVPSCACPSTHTATGSYGNTCGDFCDLSAELLGRLTPFLVAGLKRFEQRFRAEYVAFVLLVFDGADEDLKAAIDTFRRSYVQCMSPCPLVVQASSGCCCLRPCLVLVGGSEKKKKSDGATASIGGDGDPLAGQTVRVPAACIEITPQLVKLLVSIVTKLHAQGEINAFAFVGPTQADDSATSLARSLGSAGVPTLLVTNDTDAVVVAGHVVDAANSTEPYGVSNCRRACDAVCCLLTWASVACLCARRCSDFEPSTPLSAMSHIDSRSRSPYMRFMLHHTPRRVVRTWQCAECLSRRYCCMRFG